jgi:demethylsterigmatocystin 6-O-methyltransferase
MTKAYNHIPQFLAQTKYRNPCTSAPFNLAFNTTMPVFEWRKHNPENARAGQAFMAAQRVGQRSVWDGLVPLTDFNMSVADVDAHRVLVADVGGGYGHQLIDLRKLHPGLKGKMVTQDLPLVHNMRPNVDELSSLDIEAVAHDFMQPQPIRGAKVYYLRNVIHNWNDDNCKVILQQIRDAMADDSVIMIDDVVMPQTGATWKQASMDIAMMTMLAAMERTEEQFSQVLADSGLRLRDIWTYDKEYGDSLVVATPS